MLNANVHLCSKTDENSCDESLGFILPQHEYFHQSMVLADCESELFRDNTRGLEGGSFFVATLLNRREAKTQKGKDSIDAIKDFILLKADARFCHFFINKFELNQSLDNTPDHIKTASFDKKELFLNKMVEEALKDLLPYFKDAKFEDPLLIDHPLQDGRRVLKRIELKREKFLLEGAQLIDEEIAASTVARIYIPDPESEKALIDENLVENSMPLSGSRSVSIFSCKICNFKSKYKTLVVTNIESCLSNRLFSPGVEAESLSSTAKAASEEDSVLDTSPIIIQETIEDEGNDDFFWNYKNAEFFVDALFAVTGAYEKFGDGLGLYITNKILLPIFHGLRHSNYTTSIHRFITRVLCEATPKEALHLIHERFSNRSGKSGENINRDRRMEYRIGITKKLIGNLGPNFNQDSVQHVNNTVDIKEELFYETRKSHGVSIRSGKHNARSDTEEYKMLLSHLSETKAHVIIEGRTFGDIMYPKNLMDDDRFDKVQFYRWIVQKNNEAKKALRARDGI